MTEPANPKQSFEAFLRNTFSQPLNKVGAFLIGRGLSPNIVTISCLVINLIAAILVASGHLVWGGVVGLLAAPLDAVDGAMARLQGSPRKYGAFLDSVVDRYDELILLGGVLIYFNKMANSTGVILTYVAVAGSFMVSYTRARAEGLGLSGKVGILTRIERSIVTILGLLLRMPIVSVGIIAVMANFTAFQRIHSVWKQTKSASDN